MSGKVPTRIAYPKQNRPLPAVRWGYGVEPGMVACSWTKLYLADGNQFEDVALEFATKMGILQIPRGKTHENVLEDFLVEVLQFAYSRLKVRFGANLANMRKEIIYTFPATWSARSISATETIARAAGFGEEDFFKNAKISMLGFTEPEAAMALVVADQTVLSGSILEGGDCLMIVNCGGGTVDLTTYHVADTSPLLYDELTSSMGKKPL
ncbi:hypothetical protein N8T08_003241 [Aspergillus melleus]|uniref:Uncharacterized protein n=1 Tax=Aspergillus melleus TaxID=138277 RepID=A0ACC3B779_9EURO|nr:hypothetical protein N8T08_003241 [Aspergillus melleus]